MIEALRAEFHALDTSQRQLRRFGSVVGSVLIVIAIAVAWRGGWTIGAGARWLAAAGAALVGLGLLAPTALLPLYRAWMGLALVLGHVMTRVLLTLVFFLLVTPIGLIRRAVRRDPINKSPDPDLDTYWIRREGTASSERLERYW